MHNAQQPRLSFSFNGKKRSFNARLAAEDLVLSSCSRVTASFERAPGSASSRGFRPVTLARPSRPLPALLPWCAPRETG
jgi:hypothetical protein